MTNIYGHTIYDNAVASLVGGFKHGLLSVSCMGKSFPLTNSYFSTWLLPRQPIMVGLCPSTAAGTGAPEISNIDPQPFGTMQSPGWQRMLMHLGGFNVDDIIFLCY